MRDRRAVLMACIATLVTPLRIAVAQPPPGAPPLLLVQAGRLFHHGGRRCRRQGLRRDHRRPRGWEHPHWVSGRWLWKGRGWV
jgi:hypothetical protein